MDSPTVLIDFSNLAHTCWHPAQAAEDAGRKAAEEHRLTCGLCRQNYEEGDGGAVDPGCESSPPQYDARKVLGTNLGLKFNSLTSILGQQPERWTFVRDGHPEQKHRIYPAYKANRDRTKFDSRPLAEEWIRKHYPGARWAWNPSYEADDTIATLATKSPSVIVVSGDRDLWQLLRYPGCRIYSPAHKAWIGPQHLLKAFGHQDPNLVCLSKALWGDSGDNVTNAVPRMQKPLLPVMQVSDGTLMDFLEKTDQFQLSNRCLELLQDNLRQVVMNWRLVSLKTDVPIIHQ